MLFAYPGRRLLRVNFIYFLCYAFLLSRRSSLVMLLTSGYQGKVTVVGRPGIQNGCFSNTETLEQPPIKRTAREPSRFRGSHQQMRNSLEPPPATKRRRYRKSEHEEH